MAMWSRRQARRRWRRQASAGSHRHPQKKDSTFHISIQCGDSMSGIQLVWCWNPMSKGRSRSSCWWLCVCLSIPGTLCHTARNGICSLHDISQWRCKEKPGGELLRVNKSNFGQTQQDLVSRSDCPTDYRWGSSLWYLEGKATMVRHTDAELDSRLEDISDNSSWHELLGRHFWHLLWTWAAFWEWFLSISR